jgi:hypothetical protein
MGEALAGVPVVEEELRLYGGLRPVGRYVRRHEEGRDVLIYKSQVAFVPSEWQELWSRLDGTLPLWKIQRRYDACALVWVVGLYHQQLVNWANSA